MAYVRKTADEFVVQQRTAQGWEDVCAESTRSAALQRLREYRDNQPEYAARITVKRVKTGS